MTKFNASLYSNLSLDELVTYSVSTLSNEGKEATFENIVARSYELFPEKFSLVGYPQWPDSSRINKSWLRCRTDFKYIQGTVKTGFSLTSKGLEIVEKVQKRLKRPVSEKNIIIKKRARARTKEEQFTNEIERSNVFKRYLQNGESVEISHFEFCDVLYCTLESSPKTLADHLEKLKHYAHSYNRNDLTKFLLFLEHKFSDLLTDKGPERYVGGMNKVKIKGE
jgi:hypothetical protein